MIIETKYSIGDVVWHATTMMETKRHPCPDCLGTRKWKAISPAGTEYTFACPRCSTNYRAEHRLRLEYTQFAPSAQRLTIGSVQTDTYKDGDGNRYMARETGVGSGSVYYERDLFSTQKEALAVAAIRANDANNGGVEWVKQQYDETLQVKDYELADGREHLERADLSSLRWKFSDLLGEIEDCETLVEVKEIVERVREE